MYESIKSFITPKRNEDLILASELQRSNPPTLWLLGKTGSGKSSLIHAITGSTLVEIGNGFQPCTRTASIYDFPYDKPILRFLDTRGLAEAGYDPTSDIEQFTTGQQSDEYSHGIAQAIIVVVKLEDPEQSALISALKKIKRSSKFKQIITVLTAVKQVTEKERERLVSYHKSQLGSVLGNQLTTVEVDFETDDNAVYNLDSLIDAISHYLPIIKLMMNKGDHSNVEESNFNKLENEVLWYCASASATDVIPAVGLVTVPTIQAKMLHSLAQQYGIDWNKRTFAELIGTLGGSFGLQYSLKLGARQLTKFIPGYGQTVGAVTAATMSFATTYGLGRAACYYFYHKSQNEAVSAQEMQAVYKTAMMKTRAMKRKDGEQNE
ncbi:GTPase [Vibrio sp. 10N.261.55.A7]|uniref:YcjF family protein n=1 Tax=Vibrio TaxID=662 RepID=UPI000C843DF4|nr:GTPase [Vibrio sp. 10N.261.55.A7]PMJ89752.1 kinase [Vibrio sp. 10N.261.55.A7]